MQLDCARAARAQAPKAEEPEQVYGDAGAAFAIGLSLDSSFYPDASYDVYAENDATPRLGFWLAYDVATLRTDAIVAVELGYGHESEESFVLGGLHTQLDTHLAMPPRKPRRRDCRCFSRTPGWRPAPRS